MTRVNDMLARNKAQARAQAGLTRTEATTNLQEEVKLEESAAPAQEQNSHANQIVVGTVNLQSSKEEAEDEEVEEGKVSAINNSTVKNVGGDKGPSPHHDTPDGDLDSKEKQGKGKRNNRNDKTKHFKSAGVTNVPEDPDYFSEEDDDEEYDDEEERKEEVKGFKTHETIEAPQVPDQPPTETKEKMNNTVDLHGSHILKQTPGTTIGD